jgi:hypothetical protein
VLGHTPKRFIQGSGLWPSGSRHELCYSSYILRTISPSDTKPSRFRCSPCVMAVTKSCFSSHPDQALRGARAPLGRGGAKATVAHVGEFAGPILLKCANILLLQANSHHQHILPREGQGLISR